jgi:translation initiation factor IF-1
MIRSLTLLLNEIKDQYVQENFKRVENFINESPIFKPQFVFNEITTSAAVTNKVYKHNLSFTPKDVILMHVSPYTATVTWRYNKFDSNFIYFDTSAAVTIRFLLGRYDE